MCVCVYMHTHSHTLSLSHTHTQLIHSRIPAYVCARVRVERKGVCGRGCGWGGEGGVWNRVAEDNKTLRKATAAVG